MSHCKLVVGNRRLKTDTPSSIQRTSQLVQAT
nr:MAG TPA: hypothetical protein [Caudoviricetes sp.]